MTSTQRALPRLTALALLLTLMGCGQEHAQSGSKRGVPAGAAGHDHGSHDHGAEDVYDQYGYGNGHGDVSCTCGEGGYGGDAYDDHGAGGYASEDDHDAAGGAGEQDHADCNDCGAGGDPGESVAWPAPIVAEPEHYAPDEAPGRDEAAWTATADAATHGRSPAAEPSGLVRLLMQILVDGTQAPDTVRVGSVLNGVDFDGPFEGPEPAALQIEVAPSPWPVIRGPGAEALPADAERHLVRVALAGRARPLGAPTDLVLAVDVSPAMATAISATRPLLHRLADALRVDDRVLLLAYDAHGAIRVGEYAGGTDAINLHLAIETLHASPFSATDRDAIAGIEVVLNQQVRPDAVARVVLVSNGATYPGAAGADLVTALGALTANGAGLTLIALEPERGGFGLWPLEALAALPGAAVHVADRPEAILAAGPDCLPGFELLGHNLKLSLAFDPTYVAHYRPIDDAQRRTATPADPFAQAKPPALSSGGHYTGLYEVVFTEAGRAALAAAGDAAAALADEGEPGAAEAAEGATDDEPGTEPAPGEATAEEPSDATEGEASDSAPMPTGWITADLVWQPSDAEPQTLRRTWTPGAEDAGPSDGWHGTAALALIAESLLTSPPDRTLAIAALDELNQLAAEPDVVTDLLHDLMHITVGLAGRP